MIKDLNELSLIEVESLLLREIEAREIAIQSANQKITVLQEKRKQLMAADAPKAPHE